METARVDIRKLQLLNDRINQTIDALHQVRLSVHGLAHSSGQGFGQSFGNPYAPSPFQQLQGPGAWGGFGQGQQGMQGYPGVLPQGLPGISHSSPFIQQSPFLGQLQVGQPFGQGQYPPQSVQGLPGFGGTMAFQQPPWISPFGGLSHSGQEFNDPFLVARIPQTFPYAQYPFPPVISVF